MAEPKIVGTYRIDGLLEGRLFSPEDEKVVKQFAKQAAKKGLILHLSVDGGRFSLLSDNFPAKLDPQFSSASKLISSLVNDMLGNFPPEETFQMMSTLRSIEYADGYEIQTIYGIGADGKITSEDRKVAAQTVMPAQPMQQKDVIKLAAAILVVALAVIGISSFFVPYKQIARNAYENMRPFDVEKIEVEADDFSCLFTIEKITVDEDKNFILVECQGSEEFPANRAEAEEIWKKLDNSLYKRMAFEEIAKDYMVCRIFDRQGSLDKILRCPIERTADDGRKFQLQIPFSSRIQRIEMTL